ncbi:winged helix-turn-helix domain-containing protein [Dactylosporangium sp. NPDC000555]|uniref:ArsR/SmtB family transcription factor n=1 Tax=Dactylosporangium sp. NPDC000555 TaxID=3154260 RepID=UPI00332DA8CB
METPQRAATPVRTVDDVATLRALSDPIRLAIMRTLMHEADVTQRVMSVKELARELGEPQTRLYRHIKQLQTVDLVQVAETRIVSGIVEHRYRAACVGLRLSHDLFRSPAQRSQVTQAVAATFDTFRDTFLAHVGAGRVGFDEESTDAGTAPIVSAIDTRMPAARAAEFRARLQALLEEFDDEPTADATVPVELLCVFSTPNA